VHIGTQITGGNQNPSLPNCHWCHWFAIPTARSHGSQVERKKERKRKKEGKKKKERKKKEKMKIKKKKKRS
jgi:hypothetical protein